IVQRGSTEQQRTLVHVATNSIHYHFAPAAGPGSASSLQQLQCDDCHATLTLEHLAQCQSQLGLDYRAQLHRDILSLLGEEYQTAAWCARHRAISNLIPLWLD